MISLARVYNLNHRAGGEYFLVERLWPRGIRKDALKIDAWVKEAAPSHELRRWFGHAPQRWQEFKRRYFAELEAKPEAWQGLAKAARKGNIFLLYSSHDQTHNNAVALKDYLERKLGSDRRVA